MIKIVSVLGGFLVLLAWCSDSLFLSASAGPFFTRKDVLGANVGKGRLFREHRNVACSKDFYT